MRLQLSLLTLLFVVVCRMSAQAQYTVQNLPNPKTEGQRHFVSNPDGILESYTVSQLNDISQSIDSVTKAEYAIVVVNDYVGDSDFEFALELFNIWGIGKKGADNGLLLFIAKDRHEYRFISGYGMEGIFPDAYLKRVGEKYLVPNFRNGDYDQGIIEASQFIEQVLKSSDSIAELERLMPEPVSFWSFRNAILLNTLLMLAFFAALYLYVHFISVRILKDTKSKPQLIAPVFWGMGCMLLLMFITLFIFVFIFNNLEEIYQIKNLPYFMFILLALILATKISNGKSKIVESFKDEEDLQRSLKSYVKYLVLPMLLTPLAWFDLWGILNRFRRNVGRFTPPDNTNNWIRVNRSDSKAKPNQYLDPGQKKEESIKSLRYEIWKNTSSNEVRLLPWEKSSHFRDCPQCHYFTLEVNKTKTIRSATYSLSGEGEKFDSCQNCNYFRHVGFFTIPVKSRSSSGSGSSGGGSSSSGGGGSFGGGSSGGGGAGGRW
ncbi:MULTISPECIES: TPM domain-containing protein [Sphingobacterium]|uniref:TPM domain-containing protein n=1 Tax=Sphingobacterium TaxID=28453 RepID=UPI001969D8AF|nr:MULTISPECIES: TPM domain-containing protein [unclassified Sphingobacterium]